MSDTLTVSQIGATARAVHEHQLEVDLGILRGGLLPVIWDKRGAQL